MKEKKNSSNGKKTISRVYIIGAITLGIIVVATIIAVTMLIFAPHERTSKAQKYDLNCVTQLNEKPLQECRQ